MNLSEFCYAVCDDELKDSAIKNKWSLFCEELNNLDVETIKNLIEDGHMNGLIDYEQDDGFGTEGLKL